MEIARKFSARSDRVKCVDMHPTEPWILTSLYNGHVYIWNYKTQAQVKSFEVTDLPVRTGKFIARKQWVITGSDDMFIRVYNYNTMERVATFEAHQDYIRSLAIHPTQPYVLSSSDDMLIKLWDWEKGWQNIQIFEGHTHYVMMLAFNPKDPNTFASASLDRTIKIWNLGSPTPNFTLEGHDKGVNCVEYFIGGDKPYLVSGADDKTVKVWDYQNKTCVQTLEGHTHNVSVVCFHPTLPIIISGSEDGTVRLWHSNTYRLEKTLNYGMERIWALGFMKGSNKVVLGCDDGCVMIKLGSEEPAVSMEQSGKIIWAKHNEIQTANIKAALDGEVVDGERLSLPTKELGTVEVFPQQLKHNQNGRFVVVCGDGEYIIYTALNLRNKSFGTALEFVWAAEKNSYAVRESASKIKIFRNFKETKILRPPFSAEGIFGGNLLGVRSNSFITFYDLEGRVIRRIDVVPRSVYWAENGELVTIACDTSFYILKYNKDIVSRAFEVNAEVGDEGIEDAFELLHEVTERVRTAQWAGDCFVYTSASNRLNYCVGGEIFTISHLDRQMYLLGYVPRDNRLYLIDKGLNVVSYTLHLSIINYQTAIIRGDFGGAERLLPSIPYDARERVAQFLESQGHKDRALQVATDPDHKFDLAIQLGRLEFAYDIAKESDSEHKWRQLGDLALASSNFKLAEECLRNAGDLNGLLLLYTSTANAAGVASLAQLAADQGKNNVAFMCYFMLGRVDDCLKLLCSTGRIPEAAFLARTYAPSHVSGTVKLWREDLQKVNPKAAESLADPTEYENLFPDIRLGLKAEELLADERSRPLPASAYLEQRDINADRDLIAQLREEEAEGTDRVDDPAEVAEETL
jgi:coatomer subunit beta'